MSEASYNVDPTMMSINENHSFHSNERKFVEIYPDDSASGIHPNYSIEEKQMDLPDEELEGIGQSHAIQLDYDTSMPTLSTVQKNRDITLYLFDNAEPHPRIQILANEPNVVFIKTISINGVPFSDKHIVYNIQSIEKDIHNVKRLLECQKYIRLLISQSGFGIRSGLCINAPKTWVALKHALTNFLKVNSKNALFEMRWEEWETDCKLYHEPLTPEFSRVQATMQHEIEKKRDQWKLRAHLAFKKQQHQISNKRRKIDEKLMEQRRQLRRERAKEHCLQQKHIEMRRHNELLKIQKAMERQHAEKNKDLDIQMNILHDRMQLYRKQVRKMIALKDVSQSTEAVFTDYSKNIQNSSGQSDVYNVSKLENLLPNLDEINAEQISDEDNNDGNVVTFWDKMKKIEDDMSDMQQRLSVLRNL
eukprot:45146_1